MDFSFPRSGVGTPAATLRVGWGHAAAEKGGSHAGAWEPVERAWFSFPRSGVGTPAATLRVGWSHAAAEKRRGRGASRRGVPTQERGNQSNFLVSGSRGQSRRSTSAGVGSVQRGCSSLNRPVTRDVTQKPGIASNSLSESRWSASTENSRSRDFSLITTWFGGAKPRSAGGSPPHPIPLPKRREGDRLTPSQRKVRTSRASRLYHLAPWGEVGRRPGEGGPGGGVQRGVSILDPRSRGPPSSCLAESIRFDYTRPPTTFDSPIVPAHG